MRSVEFNQAGIRFREFGADFAYLVAAVGIQLARTRASGIKSVLVTRTGIGPKLSFIRGQTSTFCKSCINLSEIQIRLAHFNGMPILVGRITLLKDRKSFARHWCGFLWLSLSKKDLRDEKVAPRQVCLGHLISGIGSDNFLPKFPG